MRLDQLQRYMSEHGIPHAVALRMGLKHLDWISKDTDMQAEHWQKYSLSWEVPEGAFDLDDWAISIADALKLEEAFKIYEPTLDADDVGLIMIYGFRFHEDKTVASGWRVVFQYTYIDPDMPLM